MNEEKRWAKAITRFWKFVNKRALDECWEWNGVTDRKGYGKFTIGTKRIRAHRFSWILHFGEIPTDDSYHGICVLHECDNPSCVNPSHLFLGTQNDNMKDALKKGRRPTRKPRVMLGRRTGPDARTTTKLTPQQVSEIKELFAVPPRSRPTLREIGRQYDVSRTTIWHIVHSKTWKEI